MNKYSKQKPLTAAMQAYYMHARYPAFRRRMERAGAVSWIGPVQPTDFSPVYTVRVLHKGWGRTHVTVLDPELRTRPGEKIPHTYEGTELCLHLPHEWNTSMILAHTVLPWIALWLAFYEVWLYTGHWEGEGVHPVPKDE